MSLIRQRSLLVLAACALGCLGERVGQEAEVKEHLAAGGGFFCSSCCEAKCDGAHQQTYGRFQGKTATMTGCSVEKDQEYGKDKFSGEGGKPYACQETCTVTVDGVKFPGLTLRRAGKTDGLCNVNSPR
mmetsp:Transcript_296/g.758  ORF Transcript_296/g.758 Transcript_296/m.758 type:complete len:129 (-) Transcript_296:258-644(-)